MLGQLVPSGMQINILSVSWVQPGHAPLVPRTCSRSGRDDRGGVVTSVQRGSWALSWLFSLFHAWGFGVLHGPGTVSFQVCHLLGVYVQILFFRGLWETTWAFPRGKKKKTKNNSMLINWNKNISIASVFVSLFNLFHHLFSLVTFITFIIPTCLQFPPIILMTQQLFVINPVKDIPIEDNQADTFVCMFICMWLYHWLF